MKITVHFKLSEKGQKDAIRKGKDAQKKQNIVFSVEPSEKILSLCTIIDTGELHLDTSQLDGRYLTEEGEKKWGDFLLDFYPLNFEEIVEAYEKRREEKENYQKVIEKEEEEKLQEEANYRKHLLQIFEKRGLQGIREALPNFALPQKIEFLNFQNELAPILEAFRKEEEEEKIEEEKEKQQEKIEKERWISQFGSERLKLAIAEGYSAQKQYVTERSQQELGENARVDYDIQGKWKKRNCPSMEALETERKLKEKGFSAKTVWGYLCDCRENHICECIDHEMVVVYYYLGSYNVIVWEETNRKTKRKITR